MGQLSSRQAASNESPPSEAVSSSCPTTSEGAQATAAESEFCEKHLGLQNFGNTCYCNSVLQVLYYCGPFRRNCLKHRSDGNGMLSALSELFSQIETQRKSKSNSASSSVAPKLFIQKLRQENELFRSAEHHDAHEFFNFLVNDVADQLLKRQQQSAATSFCSASPTGYSALSHFPEVHDSSKLPSSIHSTAPVEFPLANGSSSLKSVLGSGRFARRSPHGCMSSRRHSNVSSVVTQLEQSSQPSTQRGRKSICSNQQNSFNEQNPTISEPSTPFTTESMHPQCGDSRANTATTSSRYAPTVFASSSFPSFYTSAPAVPPPHTNVGGRTWIHELLEGCLVYETKCLSCENITGRRETFLDLSVEVEEQSTLETCIQKFSSKEKLLGKDKYFCDVCCCLQEAERFTRIGKLPPFLAVHLKRFKYDESQGNYARLPHRVEFPLELNLSCCDSQVTTRSYELFAVIVHIGMSMSHGHYVCCLQSDGRWFLFDDHVVTPIEAESLRLFYGDSDDSKGVKCGYLMFYSSKPHSPASEQSQNNNQQHCSRSTDKSSSGSFPPSNIISTSAPVSPNSLTSAKPHFTLSSSFSASCSTKDSTGSLPGVPPRSSPTFQPPHRAERSYSSSKRISEQQQQQQPTTRSSEFCRANTTAAPIISDHPSTSKDLDRVQSGVRTSAAFGYHRRAAHAPQSQRYAKSTSVRRSAAPRRSSSEYSSGGSVSMSREDFAPKSSFSLRKTVDVDNHSAEMNFDVSEIPIQQQPTSVIFLSDVPVKSRSRSSACSYPTESEKPIDEVTVPLEVSIVTAT